MMKRGRSRPPSGGVIGTCDASRRGAVVSGAMMTKVAGPAIERIDRQHHAGPSSCQLVAPHRVKLGQPHLAPRRSHLLQAVQQRAIPGGKVTAVIPPGRDRATRPPHHV